MSAYAIIIADPNSSDLGEIVSTHRSESAAEKVLLNLANTRFAYVAHKKPNGEWERRLEARDRRDTPTGRPTEMHGGKRVNVYLDAISLQAASELGAGNVSEGIRKAFQRR